MKKILIIMVAVGGLLMMGNSVLAQSIPTLDQFTSTTSPALSITQRTWGKPIQITGLQTGLCLALDANGIVTTATCSGGGGGGSTFDWPFKKQNDGSQATSTTLGFFNGFNSQASSTLTSFTFNIATGTSATTTSFFAGTASTTNLFGTLINGFGLGTCTGTNAITWTGGLFTCTAQPQGTVTAIGVATANGVSGSSSGGATPNLTITLGAITPSSVTASGLGHFGNLWSDASSTLQNFTGLNSTTTNATTTTISFTTATGTTVYASNFYDTSTSGSTCIGETNSLLGTSNCVASLASAGGSLTISSPTGSVDASLNLAHANTWSGLQNFSNATSTLFSSQYASTTILCVSGDCRTAWPTGTVTSVSGSYPVLSTGGATPSLSLAFGTTTANSWSFLNNFNLSSTTVADFGNAFFGNTATSSFNGAGALFVVGSTTLQNFTATKSTTTSATTTNLAISGLSSNGFVKTYGSTGNLSVDTNTYLTSVSADAPLGGSGTSGSHLTCTGCLTAMTFSYPFPLATNGTSTLVGLFGGLITSATSTIGGGTNTTGLTISGGATTTGTFLHLASTTMQNFTGVNATTSQATTTNFAISNISSGNCLHTTTGGAIVGTGSDCAAGGGIVPTSPFSTSTSQTTGNALVFTLKTSDILTLGAFSTSTAKFFLDPNIASPTYVFQIASTTSGSGVGSSTLFGITPQGHISATSTRPSISGCGTGATISGTDAFGIVTPGTSQPGICLVTFNLPYANAPVCQVTGAGYSNGGKIWLNFNATTSTSLLSITSVATGTGATTLNVPFPSYRVAYDCKEVLP